MGAGSQAEWTRMGRLFHNSQISNSCDMLFTKSSCSLFEDWYKRGSLRRQELVACAKETYDDEDLSEADDSDDE
jgi:hypothetical protein